MLKLAYTIGPLRGNIQQNRLAASLVALQLFQKGYLPFCPHTMLTGFEGKVDEEEILRRLCSFLPLCHCAVLFGEWELSEGSRQEIATAKTYGVRVYEDVSLVPTACDLPMDTAHDLIALTIERLRKGVATYSEPLNGRGNVTPKHFHEEIADALLYVMDWTKAKERET